MSKLKDMRVLIFINQLIPIFFVLINLKQVFYLAFALFKKEKKQVREVSYHHYAVMN